MTTNTWYNQHPKDIPSIFNSEIAGRCLGGLDKSGPEVIEYMDDHVRPLIINGTRYANVVNYIARTYPVKLKSKDIGFISARVFQNGFEVVLHIYDRQGLNQTTQFENILNNMENILTYKTGAIFFIPSNDDHEIIVRPIIANSPSEWYVPFQGYEEEGVETNPSWIYGFQLDQEVNSDFVFVDLKRQSNEGEFGIKFTATTMGKHGLSGTKLSSNDLWLHHTFVHSLSDKPLFFTTIQPTDENDPLEDLGLDLLAVVEHAFDTGFIDNESIHHYKTDITTVQVDGKQYQCVIYPCSLKEIKQINTPVTDQVHSLLHEALIDTSLDVDHHPIYQVVLTDKKGLLPWQYGFDVYTGRHQFSVF